MLEELGYRQTGWTVDPQDWDPSRTPNDVARAVAEGCAAGGDGTVVLLHSWPDSTADALAGIIETVRAHSDLVGVDGSSTPALLAVDGGNSKLDAVLLTARGKVLGAARGGGSSWNADDEERSIEALRDTIRRACVDAGVDPDRRPVARLAMYCLAGADLPADDRRLLRLLRAESLSEKIVLRNDTFAVLRAGTERSWGVGVVCGTGLNCSAVAPDGRTVRYPTTGEYSGDFGGGGWMGQQALSAAIRGRDGRSPRTTLERDVPAHFGLARPLAVAEAIHVGTVPYGRLSELAPVVFRAAAKGDEVAGGIIDALADEAVAMVVSAIRRLHLTRRDVEVVLGGGIVRSRRRPVPRAHRGRDPGHRAGRQDLDAACAAGRRRGPARPRSAGRRG